MTSLPAEVVELLTGRCFDPRVAVYRFFDSAGSPLYVGVTENVKVRFSAHRARSTWWDMADLERTTVVWFGSRAEAEAAEATAISAERPQFNVLGKDGYRGGRRKTVLTEGQTRGVAKVVGLFRQRQEIEDEYRKALAELTSSDGDAVPIAYIADQLGVERKTVYRHLGRSMT